MEVIVMTEKKPENVGVINPYALAEVKLKRRIAWDRVSDPRKLLERTLSTKYEKLFDPKYDSPLYAGLKYRPEAESLERVEIRPAVEGVRDTAVNMRGVVWIDPGHYFEEYSEMTDPIQGTVGNCYFIAALSSVAWARTYVIAQRNRATDTSGGFVNMIEFYRTNKWERVEVTEKLPLHFPGNVFIYARSSDRGEIWPSVYEKAYAKWRTNHAGDRPDYNSLRGGDPVWATRQLTGLTPHYVLTLSQSAGNIWQKIRSNCMSHKTYNPMVAWTYPSGDLSPDKVNYSDANLVANHAYSILGVNYANNRKYVVLRNPWGWKEATLNIDGGIWVAWDTPYYGGQGFWRTINMARGDGIFALRVDTFKKYFAGFGWVK